MAQNGPAGGSARGCREGTRYRKGLVVRTGDEVVYGCWLQEAPELVRLVSSKESSDGSSWYGVSLSRLDGLAAKMEVVAEGLPLHISQVLGVKASTLHKAINLLRLQRSADSGMIKQLNALNTAVSVLKQVDG